MIKEDEYIRVWHCNQCNKEFDTHIKQVGSTCPYCKNAINNDGIVLKGFRSQDGVLKRLDEICDYAGYACDCCAKPSCVWRIDDPDPHELMGGHDWFFEDGECVCTVPGCNMTKRLYERMQRE